MTSPDPARPSRARRAALVLALLLSLMSLIQGDHRARKGRNALLKWAPAQEAVERGEPIYNVGAEGYPTLPLSLQLVGRHCEEALLVQLGHAYEQATDWHTRIAPGAQL